MSIVIGIASGRKHPNYEHYIKGADDVEVIRLSYEHANLADLPRCDGIVLAGGEDVNPGRYGKPEYVNEFALDDLDTQRDEFEWQVLTYAVEHAVPVFGICRGLQLANVFFGGTLVPDIVSTGKPDHTRISETEDRWHPVQVVAGTHLAALTGIAGRINSSHHQAADRIAPGFRVAATSPEGVVEAIERTAPEGLPFIQLVQWHPERMDVNDSFSGSLRQRFLTAVRRAAPQPYKS